jgi:hypothetical protein
MTNINSSPNSALEYERIKRNLTIALIPWFIVNGLIAWFSVSFVYLPIYFIPAICGMIIAFIWFFRIRLELASKLGIYVQILVNLVHLAYTFIIGFQTLTLMIWPLLNIPVIFYLVKLLGVVSTSPAPTMNAASQMPYQVQMQQFNPSPMEQMYPDQMQQQFEQPLPAYSPQGNTSQPTPQESPSQPAPAYYPHGYPSQPAPQEYQSQPGKTGDQVCLLE